MYINRTWRGAWETITKASKYKVILVFVPSSCGMFWGFNSKWQRITDGQVEICQHHPAGAVLFRRCQSYAHHKVRGNLTRLKSLNLSGYCMSCGPGRVDGR